MVISGLIVFLLFNPLSAQSSNQDAYETVVLNFLDRDLRTLDSLSGTVTPVMKERIKLTKEGDYQLMVEPPLVQFKKLEGPNYQRTIQTDLVFTDTTEHRTSLTVTDTLHKSQIKAARKTDFSALRGTDPRFRAKYLRPMLGIGGGIAIIISLFYIRSSAP